MGDDLLALYDEALPDVYGTRPPLALRYLDGLAVPEVARHLDRTVHATETLLVRARVAFRRAYGGPGVPDVGVAPLGPGYCRLDHLCGSPGDTKLG